MSEAQRQPLFPLTAEDLFPIPAEIEAERAAVAPPSYMERTANFVKRHKIAVGAGVITVASACVSPLNETLKTITETAPYVVPGLAAAEVVWVGGAAMMLGAVGKKVYNPLKIKSAFQDIPEAISRNKLFNTGFALNCGAAAAQFAIPAMAITESMPARSWGLLAFPTLELVAAVALRYSIWRGLAKQKT